MTLQKGYTLSDEALTSLMMCLQKSLLEQTDIVPVLKNLQFNVLKEELYVLNPPIVKFNSNDEDTPSL